MRNVKFTLSFLHFTSFYDQTKCFLYKFRSKNQLIYESFQKNNSNSVDVLNNSSNLMPLLEPDEIFDIACCVIFNIVSTALENSAPEYVSIHLPTP